MKTQEPDPGMKTCLLRETEKHLADLPTPPVPQEEKPSLLLYPVLNTLQLKVPPFSFPGFLKFTLGQLAAFSAS